MFVSMSVCLRMGEGKRNVISGPVSVSIKCSHTHTHTHSLTHSRTLKTDLCGPRGWNKLLLGRVQCRCCSCALLFKHRLVLIHHRGHVLVACFVVHHKQLGGALGCAESVGSDVVCGTRQGTAVDFWRNRFLLGGGGERRQVK